MNSVRPIMLVEDNPMDIDLTRRALAKRGMNNPLVVAQDGEEALRLIDDWGSAVQAQGAMPSLILLDLKLPRVDGLDVLARLKSAPKFRCIPVVVLTTSAEDSDVKRAYELGANSYIVKPVSFDAFLEVLGQIDLYWGTLNHTEHR